MPSYFSSFPVRVGTLPACIAGGGHTCQGVGVPVQGGIPAQGGGVPARVVTA